MKISPFTPLCFEPYISDGCPSRYIQSWSPDDRLMVQVLASTDEMAPTATIYNAVTGNAIDSITWQTWQMNSGKVLYFTELTGLSVGYYTVSIDYLVSDTFRITDDVALLARTVLIRYRFADNKERDDVVSLINNMARYFEWRVPGGFKDSGWQFGVANEQFATQTQNLVELYGCDYVAKQFTLGGPEGVPVWYGELLNRLLTCNYVYFDGVRYTRNESETPSISTIVDGLDSFVFTQMLRQVVDAVVDDTVSGVTLRLVNSTINRSVDNNDLRNV